MKVNFYVEDLLFFKYIGCATVAKTLYRQLQETNGVDVTWKSKENQSDISHYHTFGPFALLNRKLVGGKKVLTAHSTPRINEGNIALARVINKKYPKIYRKFDHIVTISAPCHEEVRRMVPDMPVTLISNGVNRDYFKRNEEKRVEFRAQYNIDDDRDMVLSVAQQTPRKGLYDFLALSRMYPEKTFVWVGGFPYGALSKDYAKIKQLKRKCGENVIFTGYVDEIIKPYSGADIFFMPSYAETFGLVILEALSSGLPIIARDIPEFREIFGDNILYFSDREQAAGLLEEKSLHDKYAADARAFSARFDIKDIASQHIALYKELLES